MSGPIDRALNATYAALVNRGDGDGTAAERVCDFMVALAACEELIGAMRRGDDDAVAFHGDVVRRHSRSKGLQEFQLVAGLGASLAVLDAKTES